MNTIAARGAAAAMTNTIFEGISVRWKRALSSRGGVVVM